MMKNTFNAMLKNRPKGQKVNEIYLFTLMARYLNQTAIKCTFVKQIPAQYYVSYTSNILHGQSKRVELGDLQIFTYDRSKKELRICTLQAKYEKNIFRHHPSIVLNVFQWELLKDRPLVQAISKKYPVPSNILNFNFAYKSISAYGIFFLENAIGNVDFLYTIPEFLSSKRPLINLSRRRNKRTFQFNCPRKYGNGNEKHVSGNMNMFEKDLLQCKIGAPVIKKDDLKLIITLLKYMNVQVKKENDEQNAIDLILAEYKDISDDIVIDDTVDIGWSPAMVVVTDSLLYTSQVFQRYGEIEPYRRPKVRS